ncbi:hypothetical protein K502DRAFT_364460 [Neoconidiobolus thromboides FSU 785]|nr:hypothetical protein K502DRAFT_364460 [Neoconidiobolus thromboides FSU 785]
MNLYQVMEFPDIGEQCTISSCNQLDFLPFKCNNCLKTFCPSHFQSTEHPCTNITKTIDEPIPLKASAKIDCTLKRCKRKEFNAVYCKSCLEFYCLDHRHSASHDCESVKQRKGILDEAQIAKKKKQEQKETLLSKVKESGTTQNKSKSVKIGAKVSPKVSIMIFKNKAKGDNKVPMSERIYFKLLFPLKSDKAPESLFFDKNVGIGKALDILSDKYKLPKFNKYANSVDEKKWCLSLFSAKTGKKIQTFLTTFDKVEELKDWDNGSPTLILEYSSAETEDLELLLYEDLLKV